MNSSDSAPAPLDRFLERLSKCIRGEGEQDLLSIRADSDLQERMEFLAFRCNEGILSADERDEYQTYIQFGNFVAILQAKARTRRAIAA